MNRYKRDRDLDSLIFWLRVTVVCAVVWLALRCCGLIASLVAQP